MNTSEATHVGEPQHRPPMNRLRGRLEASLPATRIEDRKMPKKCGHTPNRYTDA